MIRIVIDDAGKLDQREATALGHMFMHLAGHSLQAAPEGAQQRYDHTGEISDNICAPEPVEEVTRIDNAFPPLPLEPEEDYAPPAPPAPLAPTILDSNGIPWDSRIHARNKSQTPSGVWKLGRNISPDYVKQVLAELRGKDIVPSVPLPPQFPVQSTEDLKHARLAPAPMPPIPVPMPIAPPPPPIVTASDLYENLLNKVMTCMGNNSLTTATVNNILRSFNVNNLAALGTLSDEDKLSLIPQILTELDGAMV